MGKISVCKNCGGKLYAKGLCRSCYEINLRRQNPQFSERQRANARAWRKKHPEYSYVSYLKLRENPEYKPKHNVASNKHRLKQRGLTQASSRLLLAKQLNRCPICHREFKFISRVHLDHDYQTGKARGYLCSRCNNGLGMFLESKEILLRACVYLETPPAKEFIV